MHAFNWKNGFQRLHQKRILFYHAKRSHAHSHHTHAQSHTSLHFTYFFAPVPSTSLVVLLYKSWIQHWIALIFSITHEGEALFEIRDRYMRCTRKNFFCNTRVVRTYVKRNGPCTVHSASVHGPFNIRSKSI